MRKMVKLTINYDTCLEAYNIGRGIFYPLKGFMDSADYKNVVGNMHLDNGAPWTIPITLDIPKDRMSEFIKADKVILENKSRNAVAQMYVEDVYRIDFGKDIKKIFNTDDRSHPGVAKELSRSPYRIGGTIKILKYEKDIFSEYSLSPEEVKAKFKEKGWKTIAGFQTRNPIHRAHEYLQRIAMEVVDGIFIQPLVGWKKADDFSPVAIIKSYEEMLKKFYPKSKAMLSILNTPMRYAGPREAVFHAIIRKNFGCTHFIIGRDHAGVGNYYGKYDAHKICGEFNDLGIQILRLYGPYYCKKCACIVTEKTCPHGERHTLSISGTYIRSLFSKGKRPSEKYMRKEISDVLIKLGRDNELFCGDA